MADDPLLMADTMFVAWYVLAPDRIPAYAIAATERLSALDQPVIVSSYSLLELVYMSEKRTNGITHAELEAVSEVVTDPAGPFIVVPVDAEVALGARAIPRRFDHPNGTDTIVNADPGDRLVVATALKHASPVLTSDSKIHALAFVVDGLTVVWDEPVEQTQKM